MAVRNSQEKRIGRLDTPLGEDVLALSRFDGIEKLSDVFRFEIEALSSTESELVDFNALIGQKATVTIDTIDARKRHFNGVITEAEWIGVRQDNYVYRFVMMPWLWLLSLRTDCFIFHEKSAVDIVKKVFGRHGGLADFTADELSKSYPKLEYTVQYRESDMNFVRRLLEQHGIGFYFTHSDGAHKLVLSDAVGSYALIEGGARPFIEYNNQHRRSVEHVYSWRPERRLTSGKTMLTDYNFKKPSTKLMAEKTGDATHENNQLEIYDYPGRFMEQADGNTYAQASIDRIRAEDGHFLGSGDCVSLAPGMLMVLSDHYDGKQNREYLALRCQHSFRVEDYRTSSGRGDVTPYEGVYQFMSSELPYAPPALTPVAKVQGPQTAKVVGEGEIDVDEHGRIIVQFHWDRAGDHSMRCRLAQVWSGKQWGGIYIPRVGMEVIVECLEGNPDMPLVMGSVYNGENKPPYPLPAQKYLAGIKSQSTPGPGGGGGKPGGGGGGGGGGAGASAAGSAATGKAEETGIGELVGEGKVIVQGAILAAGMMAARASMNASERAARATEKAADIVANRMDAVSGALGRLGGALSSAGLPAGPIEDARASTENQARLVRFVGTMGAQTERAAGQVGAAKAMGTAIGVAVKAGQVLDGVRGVLDQIPGVGGDVPETEHSRRGGGAGGGGSGGGGGGGGGGGQRGYNEYVFDDTQGRELIRQHGEKDLDSVVENDERWRIKRDRHVKIERNEIRGVDGSRQTTIGSNDTLDVGSTILIKAKDKLTIEVGGAMGSTITMTPSGIKLEGGTIEIIGRQEFKSNTLMSTHQAGTIMDIKGTLVKINS